MEMTVKYNKTEEFYRVYQKKENVKFCPFEEKEYPGLPYEKYFFGNYKGDNLFGEPHG